MNHEPLANAKLNTWWHFVCALGNKCASHLDSAIIPLLYFCYGRPRIATTLTNGSDKETPTKKGMTSAPISPSSPVKKYGSMPPRCLDALAQILSCHPKPLTNRRLTGLDITKSVFNQKDFIKYNRDLFHAVSEAAEHSVASSDDEQLLLKAVFGVLCTFVCSLPYSSNPADAATSDPCFEVAAAFFDLVQKLSHTVEPEFLLNIVDGAKKLPVSVVTHGQLWRDGNGSSPLVGLTSLLVASSFSTEPPPDAKMKKHSLDVFQHLCKQAARSKNFLLTYVFEVLTILDKHPRPQKELMVSYWKAAATAINEHIDRHQDVDQSGQGNRMEHNLSAAKLALTFPLKWFNSETGRQLWKTWLELIKHATSAAALILSYQPPELEEAVAATMIDTLLSKEGKADKTSYILFSRLLTTGVFENLNLKRLKAKNNVSIATIVKLVTKLLVAVPQFATNDAGGAATHVAQAASALFAHVVDQKLLADVIDQVLPATSVLLDSGLSKTYGIQFQDAVDHMAEAAFNMLQSRYSGSFDAALAEKLAPFLVAAMDHGKRTLKTKAQQMWQVTFAGVLQVEEIPKEIAAILRKSLVLSSESSQSTASFDETIGGGVGPTTSQPVTFGSFLNRTPTKTNSATSSPAAAASPFRQFKKPEVTSTATATPTNTKKSRASSTRHSLEDESSQDFVPIGHGSKNKRRVLTDHQKEKLATRSHDIPALYSELSRDDSSVLDLPPQFQSQNSLSMGSALSVGNGDDSSQAAMDSTAFDKASAASAKSQPRRDSKEEEEAPTARPSTETDSETPAADPAPSDNNSVPRRRKAKTPVKNLPPVTKRQSANGLASLHATEPQEATKRRRRNVRNQAKNTSKVSDDDSESRENEVSDETPASTGSDAKDKVPEEKISPAKNKRLKVVEVKLSPKNLKMALSSPVKIVQENPLVIAPVTTSQNAAQPEPEVATKPRSHVVKELSFEGVEPGPASAAGNQDDEEVIPSSQQTEVMAKETSPRKSLVTGVSRKRTRLGAQSISSIIGSSGTDSSIGPKRKTAKPCPKSKAPCITEDKENRANQTTNSEADAHEAPPKKATKAQSSAKNKYGESALHQAVKKGDVSRVRSLLEAGADPNGVDNAGWAPLHDCLRDRPQTTEIVRLLVQHGANINVQAEDGNTPLHDATKNMGDAIIKCLLDLGADHSIANKNGQTAVDIAPQDRLHLFKDVFACRGPVASSVNAGKPEEASGDSATNNVQQVPETMEVDDPSAKTSLPEKPLDKLQVTLPKKRTVSLPFMGGRGAKLLEMSKAKGSSPTATAVSVPRGPQEGSSSGAAPLMSPRPDILLATPTSSGRQAWQKFAPSPSNASPSCSILKKSVSMDSSFADDQSPPVKRRRVQFSDPPVSEKVEIPRSSVGSPASRAARQKYAAPKSKFATTIELETPEGVSAENSSEENLSTGLYEATPPVSNDKGSEPEQPLYPCLVSNTEPVTSVLSYLATVTWQKAVEKSLSDAGVRNIGDLSSLTPSKARDLKGLLPPNNVATIQEALKKFEKTLEQRKEQKKVVAPVVDVSTPEEEDAAMKDLYERPSPTPNEEEQTKSKDKEEAKAEEKEEGKEAEEDIGPPPPLIRLDDGAPQTASEAPPSEPPPEMTDTEVQAAADTSTTSMQTEDETKDSAAIEKRILGYLPGLEAANLLKIIQTCTTLVGEKLALKEGNVQ